MHILIADDIQIIRAGIISVLLDAYKDVVFYEAEDGNEAVEIACKNDLDLIITDIKMPLCNGLEMMQRLREKDNQTPIIIVSGFSEFAYAQKAIRLGALGYLLKPIEASALLELTEKARSLANDTRAVGFMSGENTKLEQQNIHLKTVIALQNTLLFDAPFDTGLLNQPYFCLSIIHIEKSFSETSSFYEGDIELLCYALSNLIEYLELKQNYYLFKHPTQTKMLILFYSDNRDALQNDVYIAMQTICAEIYTSLGISVSAGISTVCENISPVIYKQASEAIYQKVLKENSGLYFYTEKESVCHINVQDIHLIQQLLLLKDMHELQKLLLAKLKEYVSKSSVTSALNVIMPIIFSGMAKQYSGSFEELAKSLSPLSILKEDFKNLEELAAYITKLIEKFYQENSIALREGETIASQVKEYIDKNYSHDLSVKKLAEKFCVNYSYLSALFTKEIGMGIVAYEISVRMDAAKSLLTNTSTDISGIAQMVGYEDVQYFYRVFKKYAGKTPLAWRNEPKKVQ